MGYHGSVLHALDRKPNINLTDNAVTSRAKYISGTNQFENLGHIRMLT